MRRLCNIGILFSIGAAFAMPGLVSAAGAARVYVSEFGHGSVAVIDTATATVTTTIDVGGYPLGIAVNGAGTAGYVAVDEADNARVAFLDLANNRVQRTVPFEGSVRDVALDATQTRLFVLSGQPNAVSVLDASSGALLNTISMPVSEYVFPVGLALNPTSGEMYALFDSSTAVVIDAQGNGVSRTLNTDDTLMPSGLAVGARDGTLYVANWAIRSGFDPPPGADIITVIPAYGDAATARISVGEQVLNVAVDPQQSRLFATTYRHLKEIDAASGTVSASIEIPPAGGSMAFDSAADRLYVSAGGDGSASQVLVIDPSSARVLASITVPGANRIAIASAPAGVAPAAQAAPATSVETLAFLMVALAFVALAHRSRRSARD